MAADDLLSDSADAADRVEQWLDSVVARWDDVEAFTWDGLEVVANEAAMAEFDLRQYVSEEEFADIVTIKNRKATRKGPGERLRGWQDGVVVTCLRSRACEAAGSALESTRSVSADSTRNGVRSLDCLLSDAHLQVQAPRGTHGGASYRVQNRS